MHDTLHIENLTLRRHLEALLQEARHNEDKLRRFDVLERRIIGAGSFTELVQLLLSDYRRVFGIETVSLVLVDPEYEVPRLLADAGLADNFPGLCPMPDDAWLSFCFGDSHRTWLGAYDPVAHGRLFADVATPPASVALLPLLRQDRLIGCLNLGSEDADRYTAQSGTEFLDRLASVAAVCVESALARERLKRAGVTDALTGVHNRGYFDQRCPAEASQSRRHGQPLACMFLDIDRFKRINDSHGHQVGDRVLKAVAAVIKAQLRTSDTLSRYGGEEFVALLPQTATGHAREIAERIRKAVEALQVKLATGERVPVTISIGLSMCPADACGDQEQAAAVMVNAADQALYAAKHGGRNRVVSSGGEGTAGCQATPAARLWQRVKAWGNALKRLPVPVPGRP